MKILGKIAGLGALVLSLNGCNNQNNETARINDANRVLKNGVTKDLTIHLSTDGVGLGPEIRFIDIDGDGKTVEQYVLLYDLGKGFPIPYGMQENLVRPGAKPIDDPDNIYKKQRTMTSQEEAQIDSTYQALLKLYKK